MFLDETEIMPSHTHDAGREAVTSISHQNTTTTTTTLRECCPTQSLRHEASLSHNCSDSIKI